MKRSEGKQVKQREERKGEDGKGHFFILFFFLNLFIVFGCTGSLLLCMAFSSGSDQELLFTAVFSCCRTQAVGVWGFIAGHTGLVAPPHVESSQTRG